MDSTFTGINIFYCEGRDGGVHCELVVGQGITIIGIRAISGGAGGLGHDQMGGVKIRVMRGS